MKNLLRICCVKMCYSLGPLETLLIGLSVKVTVLLKVSLEAPKNDIDWR